MSPIGGKKACIGTPGNPCPNKVWFKIKGRKMRCSSCQREFPRAYYRAKRAKGPGWKGIDPKWRDEKNLLAQSLKKARVVEAKANSPRACSRLIDLYIAGKL